MHLVFDDPEPFLNICEASAYFAEFCCNELYFFTKT
jgi:hypothetical protein